MSGVTLKVDVVGLDQVEKQLNKLVMAGHDMTPAMRDIGEHLLRTTRDRFESEESPDGTPWAPLSATTKARKSRNVGKVLTERGFLRGNLAYRASSHDVEVGSPSIYAGTHQFGAQRGAFGATSKGSPIPWGDIPARPFLGLSTEDSDELTGIMREYIESQLA